MIIILEDWELEIDIPATMEWTGRHASEHCTCGYCENFYRTVDTAYPHMRPFLAQLGVNIEGPDEFCPFEPNICEATYVATGRIIHRGKSVLFVDGVPIHISDKLDMDHTLPKPCFGFIVGLMELPWVLDEPMEDVISPANEPECLDRMWKKLLQRSDLTYEQ